MRFFILLAISALLAACGATNRDPEPLTPTARSNIKTEFVKLEGSTLHVRLRNETTWNVVSFNIMIANMKKVRAEPYRYDFTFKWSDGPRKGHYHDAWVHPWGEPIVMFDVGDLLTGVSKPEQIGLRITGVWGFPSNDDR